MIKAEHPLLAGTLEVFKTFVLDLNQWVQHILCSILNLSVKSAVMEPTYLRGSEGLPWGEWQGQAFEMQSNCKHSLCSPHNVLLQTWCPLHRRGDTLQWQTLRKRPHMVTRCRGNESSCSKLMFRYSFVQILTVSELTWSYILLSLSDYCMEASQILGCRTVIQNNRTDPLADSRAG